MENRNTGNAGKDQKFQYDNENRNSNDYERSHSNHEHHNKHDEQNRDDVGENNANPDRSRHKNVDRGNVENFSDDMDLSRNDNRE